MYQNPLDLLKKAVDDFSPFLQPDGELYDPLFQQPTQYGTPYYAWCNAVLAEKYPSEAGKYIERAGCGLRTSLNYINDPSIPARGSAFSRETGAVSGINHRDFFLPAVLKTYHLLKKLSPSLAETFTASIRAVDHERSFSARPPSNWAAVWLSGEWLRQGEGLSPLPATQVDTWLEPFFETHILNEMGFYLEPGLPNSYDLFTRYHLADILLNGYQGRWQEKLDQLLRNGLRRSLAVQLSDGSLASHHRSTGQSWTLGCQCAFFQMAARYLQSSDPALSQQAAQAASRAYRSLRRWQRPQGLFSPAENCLPPAYRVGYEGYTSDGHYSVLALAFLAVAIHEGFDHTAVPESRPAQTIIEGQPTFRALIHNGETSLHIDTNPAAGYDAFGISDITFGVDRLFHLASSVKHLESGHFFNPGLALRFNPGVSAPLIICQQPHSPNSPLLQGTSPASLTFQTRLGGQGGGDLRYTCQAEAHPQGVTVHEGILGRPCGKTLFIPYLLDSGCGWRTRLEILPGEVRFHAGNETIALLLEQPVELLLDLPHGFENRRGLCGLLRLDFQGQPETIGWTLQCNQ